MKTKIFMTLLFLLTMNMTMQSQSTTPKMLVVYFSWSGNTSILAEQIKSATGADIFEIVPVTAYPEEYNKLTELAKKQIQQNIRPAIKNKVDLSKYDMIFVGSPCWWSTIAPPVATFLTSYDFSGKTIVPFMTHGGSQMGHSEADIRKLCPGATLLEALAVYGNQVDSSKAGVEKWLRKTEILK